MIDDELLKKSILSPSDTERWPPPWRKPDRTMTKKTRTTTDERHDIVGLKEFLEAEAVIKGRRKGHGITNGTLLLVNVLRNESFTTVMDLMRRLQGE